MGEIGELYGVFFSLNNLLQMSDITSLKGAGKICIVYFNIAESKS